MEKTQFLVGESRNPKGGIYAATNCEITVGYSRWSNQLKQHFCHDYLVVIFIVYMARCILINSNIR